MAQGSIDPQDKNAALFANLVMQQANAAFMFLGKVPNPETGQPVTEIETARYFIDQLEMLDAKTKGNLTPEETRMLQETLTAVRMTFVETARQGGTTPQPAPSQPAAEPAAEATEPSNPPAESAAPPAEDADSRKKFVKKY